MFPDKTIEKKRKSKRREARDERRWNKKFKKLSHQFELSQDCFISPKLSLDNQKKFEKFQKQLWQIRKKKFKKASSSVEFQWKSRFKHISLDCCQRETTKDLFKFPYKVVPIPNEKSAIKGKSFKTKPFLPLLNKYFWIYQYLKPFDFYTKTLENISISSTKGISVLDENEKEKPKYWSNLKFSSKFFETPLHKEFNEKFSEYDIYHYSLEDNSLINSLKAQYFENFLSKEELKLSINKELAPHLNSLNKLLNEQPFLVLPIKSSALLYSLLPEFDGIFHEFKKYKITENMIKKVSLKDNYVSGKKTVGDNLLCLSPSHFFLSTIFFQKLNAREWKSFGKIKRFNINDFSLKCYSAFNPFTSLSNAVLIKLSAKLIRRFYWRNKLRAAFLIDNDALNCEGLSPSFEKKMITEDYKYNSFSQPSIYWAKEYQSSLKNNVKLSEL
ncbi:hypothetical protein [Mycoplasma parvum]|uniref:Uncharacterized protein n=1 Tax=Mycoplasma parvum str. Indiana TaxID=1403316 RepID=U5NCI2_9MOLU|nr:hypothetical protein [Mycoplasma parvum]AGX89291.1 hypothetical protein PRV_02825 [Mycoplasma parvum str. Indiana]